MRQSTKDNKCYKIKKRIYMMKKYKETEEVKKMHDNYTV